MEPTSFTAEEDAESQAPFWRPRQGQLRRRRIVEEDSSSEDGSQMDIGDGGSDEEMTDYEDGDTTSTQDEDGDEEMTDADEPSEYEPSESSSEAISSRSRGQTPQDYDEDEETERETTPRAYKATTTGRSSGYSEQRSRGGSSLGASYGGSQRVSASGSSQASQGGDRSGAGSSDGGGSLEEDEEEEEEEEKDPSSEDTSESWGEDVQISFSSPPETEEDTEGGNRFEFSSHSTTYNDHESWRTFQFKVLALAKQHFFSGQGHHLTVQHLNGGTYNRVASVEINGLPRYVIRIPRQDRAGSQAHKILMDLAPLAFLQRNTSIPSPRVLAASTASGNPISMPYMIMERLVGDCLDPYYSTRRREFALEDRMNVARELGMAYAEMHRTTNAFPGHLVFPEGTVDPDLSLASASGRGGTEVYVAPFNIHLGRQPITASGAQPWSPHAPPAESPADFLSRMLEAEIEAQKQFGIDYETRRVPQILSDLARPREDQIIRHEAIIDDARALGENTFAREYWLAKKKEELRLTLEKHRKALEPAVRKVHDRHRILQWFLVALKSMDELGYFPEDMPNVLMHADMAERNLVYNRLAGREGRPGLGMLDWDDCYFVPAFMACRPPAFIWSDKYDADYWNEPADEIEELTADEEAIKREFDKHAGPVYRRYAYDPVYQMARQMMRICIMGMDPTVQKKAYRMANLWYRMYQDVKAIGPGPSSEEDDHDEDEDMEE